MCIFEKSLLTSVMFDKCYNEHTLHIVCLLGGFKERIVESHLCKNNTAKYTVMMG